MEFMDKMNAFAKAAAEKTNEVIGDTKVKAQILNDEKSIRELETKIGAYYYKKFAAGEAVDEGVQEYCTAISVHLANIEEKKSALNKAASSPEEESTEKETPFSEEDVFESQD